MASNRLGIACWMLGQVTISSHLKAPHLGTSGQARRKQNLEAGTVRHGGLLKHAHQEEKGQKRSRGLLTIKVPTATPKFRSCGDG